jgi:hypothetical protein
MATNDKKIVTVTIEKRSSRESLAPPSLKSPRTARFAEATSVYSPIDAKSPFADPPTFHYKPQPQVSDVGFGYVHHEVEMEAEEHDRKYLPPPTPRSPGPLRSPLKSAMKSPGAPPRTPGAETMILSPTFREEQILEKTEAKTDKEQAKDLVCTGQNI